MGAIEHPERPYPRILKHWVASPLRETQRRPRPLQRKVPTKASSLHRAGFDVEYRRCGTHARCLDGTTLARKYLSTAKTVRPEHKISFARSLRHVLRVFCRPHNALQLAPVGGPHNEARVTNLERATKLLRIILALLQSSDGRCSRQERYNENTRGKLAGLIGWLVVFTGSRRQKAR